MFPTPQPASADYERLDQAVAECDRLISLEPGRVDAYDKKAMLLNELGRPRQALEEIERALRLDPGNPRLYWRASLCHLQIGDFKKGWQLYGSRHAFLSSTTAGGVDRASRVRRDRLWTGRESLAGRTLFIQSEQGLGDLIQFCRYIPLLESEGARVILSVPPAMRRILRGLSSKTVLMSEEDPVPVADYDCMLLGLPAACATTVDTIPAAIPYLLPEPERVEHWSQRLGAEGFKVGICWQGKPGRADVGRSSPLSAFAPLAAIPGVRLISLQKGAGLEQITAPYAPIRVQDLGTDFDATGDAFVDTAAIMLTLDLVVTIDSAVAHLAGALGARAWVALKLSPDWRWFLDRADSPFYPSLRLFRQPSIGDWDSVFSAMGRELRGIVHSRTLPVRAG